LYHQPFLSVLDLLKHPEAVVLGKLVDDLLAAWLSVQVIPVSDDDAGPEHLGLLRRLRGCAWGLPALAQ
jgi:hypothetical protein